MYGTTIYVCVFGGFNMLTDLQYFSKPFLGFWTSTYYYAQVGNWLMFYLNQLWGWRSFNKHNQTRAFTDWTEYTHYHWLDWVYPLSL